VVIAINVGVVLLNIGGSLEATAVGLNVVVLLSLMETSELVEAIDPKVAAALKAVDNMTDNTSDDDRINTMMMSVSMVSSEPAEAQLECRMEKEGNQKKGNGLIVNSKLNGIES
jgi:hypothetical protein